MDIRMLRYSINNKVTFLKVYYEFTSYNCKAKNNKSLFCLLPIRMLLKNNWQTNSPR